METDIRELMREARITTEQARELTGKTSRQFRRYTAGTAPVPVAVARVLEARAGGLGWLHPDWDGWRLNPGNGHLVTPWGDWWSAADLRALWWYHQQLAAQRASLRRQIRELEAENVALRARFGPWNGPPVRAVS